MAISLVNTVIVKWLFGRIPQWVPNQFLEYIVNNKHLNVDDLEGIADKVKNAAY